MQPLKKELIKEYLFVIDRLENEAEPLSKQALEAHFEKIQHQIIEEINKAQYVIWIAVAWFTDRKIFQRLAHRKHEGLTVELILLNHPFNKNSGLDYNKYLTTFWADQHDLNQLMHNKFCVIDLKTCITGSYNWTKAASEKNLENITIGRNTDTVNGYATEFLKIRKMIVSATKRDI